MTDPTDRDPHPADAVPALSPDRLDELERNSRRMLESTAVSAPYDVAPAEVLALVREARWAGELEAEVGRLLAELISEKKNVRGLVQDACDADDHLERLCRAAGIPEAEITGDGYATGIEGKADLLAAELARAKAELEKQQIRAGAYATMARDANVVLGCADMERLRDTAERVVRERDTCKAAAEEVAANIEDHFSALELVTTESLIGEWRDRLRKVAGPAPADAGAAP